MPLPAKAPTPVARGVAHVAKKVGSSTDRADVAFDGVAFPLIGPPLSLEIGVNSGSLTNAFVHHGAESWSLGPPRKDDPVDIFRLRVHLDDVDVLGDLLHLVCMPRVLFVYFRPPCSTALATRDRAVPQGLVARGVRGAPTLRSAEHPLGLPDHTHACPSERIGVVEENGMLTNISR